MPLVTVQSNALDVANKLGVKAEALNRVTTYFGKEVARKVKLDFQRTTQNWNRRPEATSDVSVVGATVVVTAGIMDYIWTLVDKGTPAHEIAPTKPGGMLAFQWGGVGSYVAHTTPGIIGSAPGGPVGDVVFRRVVHHPGTKPRGFTLLISDKWRAAAPDIMRKYVSAWVKDDEASDDGGNQ